MNSTCMQSRSLCCLFEPPPPSDLSGPASSKSNQTRSLVLSLFLCPLPPKLFLPALCIQCDPVIDEAALVRAARSKVNLAILKAFGGKLIGSFLSAASSDIIIIIFVPHWVIDFVSHPCPWLTVFGHVTQRALWGRSVGQDGSQQEFDWLLKQTLGENEWRLTLTTPNPMRTNCCLRPLVASILRIYTNVSAHTLQTLITTDF